MAGAVASIPFLRLPEILDSYNILGKIYFFHGVRYHSKKKRDKDVTEPPVTFATKPTWPGHLYRVKEVIHTSV